MIMSFSHVLDALTSGCTPEPLRFPVMIGLWKVFQ
jgi:hypothetical protein